jgi:hypothetical protein
LGVKYAGAHLFNSEVQFTQQIERTHNTPRLDPERFLTYFFFTSKSSEDVCLVTPTIQAYHICPRGGEKADLPRVGRWDVALPLPVPARARRLHQSRHRGLERGERAASHAPTRLLARALASRAEQGPRARPSRGHVLANALALVVDTCRPIPGYTSPLGIIDLQDAPIQLVLAVCHVTKQAPSSCSQVTAEGAQPTARQRRAHWCRRYGQRRRRRGIGPTSYQLSEVVGCREQADG